MNLSIQPGDSQPSLNMFLRPSSPTTRSQRPLAWALLGWRMFSLIYGGIGASRFLMSGRNISLHQVLNWCNKQVHQFFEHSNESMVSNSILEPHRSCPAKEPVKTNYPWIVFTQCNWTCSDLVGKIKHQVKKTQGPRRKPVVTRRKPVETCSEIQKHRVLEKHRVFLTHRKPVKTRRKPVKTRAKNMGFLGSWAYVSKRVF